MPLAIRKEVQDLAQLGPLPDSATSDETIALHQDQLKRITPPVTNDEAEVLLQCFGPDDCYGLAWTLLHLIESAPQGCPLKLQPSPSENEWVRRLWDRSNR